ASDKGRLFRSSTHLLSGIHSSRCRRSIEHPVDCRAPVSSASRNRRLLVNLRRVVGPCWDGNYLLGRDPSGQQSLGEGPGTYKCRIGLLWLGPTPSRKRLSSPGLE